MDKQAERWRMRESKKIKDAREWAELLAQDKQEPAPQRLSIRAAFTTIISCDPAFDALTEDSTGMGWLGEGAAADIPCDGDTNNP